MSAWVKLAEPDSIPVGGRLSVEVDDVPALLLRDESGYYCIEDVCSHDGQPLTDGPFVNGCITCPRHGARFDVKTGGALCMPATEGIQTFQVEARADGVYVAVP